MNNFEQYVRQMMIPGFGESRQNQLANARILVVGAGGLGCPAMLYLAAAGIGNIGVIDFDIIEISNLHRQILFGYDDIGKNKATTAAFKLTQFYPAIKVDAFPVKLQKLNAVEIIDSYDLVIDGSDNFETRYLINDVCVLLNKPLVFGSVYRFEGQVAVFNLKINSAYSANYRDFFSNQPLPGQVPDCNEAGVIGVMPGLIGVLQASEAIKIITGFGEVLINAVLNVDLQNNSFYKIALTPSASNRISAKEFEARNYQNNLCDVVEDIEISGDELEVLIGQNPDCMVVDIREKFEAPPIENCKNVSIPLSELDLQLNQLKQYSLIVFVCQTGKRSTNAVLKYSQNLAAKCMSLKGGVLEWNAAQLKH